MKKIKLILTLLVFITSLSSCIFEDKGNDPDFSNLSGGLYPEVSNIQGGFYNIGDITNTSSGFTVGISSTSEGLVVNSVSIIANFNDKSAVVESGLSVPATVNYALGQDILSTLGVDPTTIVVGDNIKFTFLFDTNKGSISSPVNTIVPVKCLPKAGVYTIVMNDAYGDGWQTDDGNGGTGITVDIDGAITEVGMCSYYTCAACNNYACTPGNGIPPNTPDTNVVATVTIPDGAQNATWYFPGDQYGEISFQVFGPDNELLYSYAEDDKSAGEFQVVLCQ